MTVFTIGCDPELFVTKRGKPASAFGLLKGTKDEPHPTDYGAYQVDGMAAEFNTDPVVQNDFWAFNRNVVEQMKALRHALPKGYSLRAAPVMDFGQDFIDKQPAAAKELGCDPDYNAYTLEKNPRPDGDVGFRTGAGHIHVGWGADIPTDNAEHMEICANFVKTLDSTVGLFMTMIDNEPRRRQLYGKAGAFRPKPYGVEYRTPSNVWVKTKDYREAVFNLTCLATKFHRSIARGQATTYDYCRLSPADIREIVDTGDVVSAAIALNHVMRWRFEGLWRRLVKRRFGIDIGRLTNREFGEYLREHLTDEGLQNADN